MLQYIMAMPQWSPWVPNPTWLASLLPILEYPGHLMGPFEIPGTQAETPWTEQVLNPHQIPSFAIPTLKFLPLLVQPSS